MTVLLSMSVISTVVLLSVIVSVDQANARKRLPLKDHLARPHRRVRNATECYFGKKIYEIEERWSPDLGPPFGVMFCIQCECLAVSKKKRIVARTRCRNIKNECPRPKCREPTLLPGRCCKSCPGSDTNRLEDDIALSKTEMEASSRSLKFVALLTGYSMKDRTPSPGSARVHFTFRRRNLHYTIYTNGLEQVTSVRFTDQQSNIVQEHQVPMRNSSSKICGIWRKLPRVYRRMLQKERLSLVLATRTVVQGIVAGPIIRYIPIDSVLFEAVLAPDQRTLGAGGMATISVEGLTVLLSLSFNGLLANSGTRPVTLKVLLEKVNEKEGSKIMVKTSSVTIVQHSTDHDVVSMKISFTNQEMKQMSRGKFLLSLMAQNDSRKIFGKIVPVQTCDVFQAVLSGQDSFEEVTPNTGATGMALFELNDSGSIEYTMRLMALSSEVISVSIQLLTRRLRTREMEEVLPFYMNGWANGSYSKTTPRDIDMLMKGNILVNVGTEDFLSEIRGRVERILHTEVHQYGHPLLMKGNHTSSAGIAWLYVDNHCRLHYDVSVSGMSRRQTEAKKNFGDERHILELEEIPGQTGLSKSKRIILQKFDGIYTNSIMSNLNQVTLSRLDSGVSYLKLISKHYAPNSKAEKQEPIKVLEIQTRIHHVKVPSSCLPNVDAVDPSLSGGMIQYEQQSNSVPENGQVRTKTCYYDGKLFEDGSQWMAEHNKCMMCSCQRRRVVCDPMVCPNLTCLHKITLPGECCPSCRDPVSSNNTSDLNSSHNGCFFEGDKRFHTAGTRWHPYLPPHGFSKCALCTCESSTLEVKCRRITCEPLTCPEHKAYREHPMSCCKKCPIPRSYTVSLKAGDTSALRDEGSVWTIGEILSRGGCKYRNNIYKNGDFWNPIVKPFGTIQSICCHCKDGKRRCYKRSCSTETINSSKKDALKLCPDKSLPPCEISAKKEFRRRKQRRKS